MANNILNKQLLKKWWFWTIAVVVLGLIGLATGGGDTSTTTDTTSNNSNTSVQTGTLPALDEADYTDKEGLVVFKELDDKGYTVTAKYVNEAVPATNQELTDQFASADVNSCSDRLGFDAYVVSGVTQDGDNVALTLSNEPTDNQTCPAGTTNDL